MEVAVSQPMRLECSSKKPRGTDSKDARESGVEIKKAPGSERVPGGRRTARYFPGAKVGRFVRSWATSSRRRARFQQQRRVDGGTVVGTDGLRQAGF